jgi:hypothetical protein
MFDIYRYDFIGKHTKIAVDFAPLIWLISISILAFFLFKFKSNFKNKLYLFFSISTFISIALGYLVTLLSIFATHHIAIINLRQKQNHYIDSAFGINFTNSFSDVVFFKGDPSNVETNNNGVIKLEYNYRYSKKIIGFIGSTVKNSIKEIGSIQSSSQFDFEYPVNAIHSVDDLYYFFDKNVFLSIDENKDRVYVVGNLIFHFEKNELMSVTIVNKNIDRSKIDFEFIYTFREK